MSEDPKSPSQAELEATRARSKLTTTLVDIQARLHPKALLRDAFTELRATGTEVSQGAIAAARRNPALFIAVGVMLVGFFARHKLFRALVPHKSHGAGQKSSRSTEFVVEDRVSPIGKETEK